jgi:hypothetical protein
MPAGIVTEDQVPLMLFPVIEVNVVGAIVVIATNGPVVDAVEVTSWKPPVPIEYSVARLDSMLICPKFYGSVSC